MDGNLLLTCWWVTVTSDFKHKCYEDAGSRYSLETKVYYFPPCYKAVNIGCKVKSKVEFTLSEIFLNCGLLSNPQLTGLAYCLKS